MIFVSVHVPKTAGTSLAYTFDHGSGRRILYDYASDYSNVTFTDEERSAFQAAIPYIERHFVFIHGHFYLEKYRGLIPDAKYITCFRHPVDRTISQYKHIYFERNPDSPVYQAIQNGMSVVDFIGDRNVRDAHRVHLSGADPQELDFIFLNADLTRGLNAFAARYPGVISGSWVRVNKLNTGRERSEKAGSPDEPALSFSEAERRELFRRMPEEVEYYRAAVAAYQTQIDAILS